MVIHVQTVISTLILAKKFVSSTKKALRRVVEGFFLRSEAEIFNCGEHMSRFYVI